MGFAERLIAVAQLALGIALVAGSVSLRAGRGGDPGPGGFPLLIGLLAVASAIGLWVHASHLPAGRPPAISGRWRLALGSVVFSGIYFALVPIVGYYSVTTVAVGGMVWGLGLRSAGWIVGTAVGFVVANWLLFTVLFRVPLPTGILG